METQIVELINVSQDISWLPWGVLYFFLIGISCAGFFLSLAFFVFDRSHLEGLARVALVVALTCGIAAPIALVSDLHQPARFYNFYLHFTAGSWMSWGSYFLPVYVMGLMLYSWLIYRPGLAVLGETYSKAAVVFRMLGGAAAPQAVKMIGLITALAAILVMLYTGSEMAIVKTRGLWHGIFMPLLFLTTALTGAGGLVLVLNKIFGNAENMQQIPTSLSRYMVITSGLTLILTVIWLLSGVSGVSVSGIMAMRLATEYNPVSFWLLWLALGTLLPLMLIKNLPVMSGALTLFGAWIFRWSMFIDGQRIPKTGSGFFAYEIPWGSEGILSIVGTLGIWVLLLLIVTTFTPWQGSTAANGKAIN